MEHDKTPGRIVYGLAPHVGETNADYRQRMAFLQAEALEQRQQELREQASPLNSASARIRIWERLHQLELPRRPSHPLVAIIAANTGLSTDDVLAEQQLRASPPIAAISAGPTA